MLGGLVCISFPISESGRSVAVGGGGHGSSLLMTGVTRWASTQEM